MFDFTAEIDRRIDQFHGYLAKMHDRAHVIAECSCFLIFEERRHGGRDARNEAERSRAARAPTRSTVVGPSRDAPELPDGEDESLPEDGWRRDESMNRFVQFSFERKWFCMDMPRQTLFRPEAGRLLRERSGFFRLADRPEFTLHGEDVDGFDPFRKIYLYGDERDASEDTAFIFFDVWKFPVDTRLYVRTGDFGWKHEWERGRPLE